MITIIRSIIFLIFMQKALAGLCSSNSVVPFSGYKVTRRHKIRIRPLKSDSFLVLTKCHRGIPLFSRTIPTSSTLDEFATPFCVAHTEFDFSDRQRKKKRMPGLPQAPWSGDESASTSGLLADKLAKSLQLKKWFSTKSGANSTAATNPNHIQGNSGGSVGSAFKRKHNLAETEKETEPEPEREVEIPTKRQDLPRAAPCLKIARRKRYARLDVVIFIPATFVGLLFACTAINGEPIEDLGKSFQYKQRKTKEFDMGANSFVQHSFVDDTFEPTAYVGSPVCPLVADDYTSHWISIKLNPPALIYHVPYLRSPSSWDPRFKSFKWEEDIDINEAYIYTHSELSKIGITLAASATYMRRLFAAKRTKVSHLLALKLRWLRKFDLRLQLSLHLFSLGKSVAFRHVVKLQRLWDGLFHANERTSI